MNEFIKFDDKEYIFLIGAGGKTTLMNYLRELFLSQKKKCFITTTTKIGKNQTAAQLIFNKEQIVNGCCLINTVSTENKLSGLTIEELDEIYKNTDFSIIVEADGAKMKPLKFPSDNEPVISKFATKIILVIGLDSLNKKYNAENFHRIELFNEKYPCFKNCKLINLDLLTIIINEYYNKCNCRNFYLLFNKFDECSVDLESLKLSLNQFDFPAAVASLKDKKIERIK